MDPSWDRDEDVYRKVVVYEDHAYVDQHMDGNFQYHFEKASPGGHFNFKCSHYKFTHEDILELSEKCGEPQGEVSGWNISSK